MVLKCPLDGLVEEVWGEKFIYVHAREVGCIWLGPAVSTNFEHSTTQLTRKSGTIP